MDRKPLPWYSFLFWGPTLPCYWIQEWLPVQIKEKLSKTKYSAPQPFSLFFFFFSRLTKSYHPCDQASFTVQRHMDYHLIIGIKVMNDQWFHHSLHRECHVDSINPTVCTTSFTLLSSQMAGLHNITPNECEVPTGDWNLDRWMEAKYLNHRTIPIFRSKLFLSDFNTLLMWT